MLQVLELLYRHTLWNTTWSHESIRRGVRSKSRKSCTYY